MKGVPVSLDNSNDLHIGSRLYTLTPAATDGVPDTGGTGGKSMLPDRGVLTIGDQIVSQGGPAVTIAGTPVSLDQHGDIIVSDPLNGLTTAASYQSDRVPMPITIGGQVLTPKAARSLSTDNIKASEGTAAAMASKKPLATTLSDHSSPEDVFNTPTLTINGHAVTPNPTGFLLEPGKSVLPGAPAVTESGTRISLDAAGTALYINSQTIPLSSVHAVSTNHPITLSNGEIITPNPLGFLLAPGISLAPGGPAQILYGTVFSLDRKGVLAMDSHSTVSFNSLLLPGGAAQLASGPTPTPTLPASVVTLAGHAITAAATDFVITDGTVLRTVSPGGSAVIENGTTINLNKDGVLEMESTSVTSLAAMLPTSVVTEASPQSATGVNKSFDDGDKKSLDGSGKSGSDGDVVPFVNESTQLSCVSLGTLLLLGIITVNTAVYILS